MTAECLELVERTLKELGQLQWTDIIKPLQEHLKPNKVTLSEEAVDEPVVVEGSSE